MGNIGAIMQKRKVVKVQKTAYPYCAMRIKQSVIKYNDIAPTMVITKMYSSE